MPTPVGHILAGAVIYKSQKESGFLLLSLLLFFALLPDIDFLFGFVAGDPAGAGFSGLLARLHH